MSLQSTLIIIFLIPVWILIATYFRFMLFANVVHGTEYCVKTFQMKKNGDVEKFLNELDFCYDNGYGIQELFGILWFEDDIWADRDEYDGAECWEIHKVPEIPNYLISNEGEVK